MASRRPGLSPEGPALAFRRWQLTRRVPRFCYVYLCLALEVGLRGALAAVPGVALGAALSLGASEAARLITQGTTRVITRMVARMIAQAFPGATPRSRTSCGPWWTSGIWRTSRPSRRLPSERGC